MKKETAKPRSIMRKFRRRRSASPSDPAAFDDPIKLQEALLKRLRSIYYAYEVYRLDGYKKKLQEPDLNFIFGTEFKWDSKEQRHLARTVSEPSITQLVELGFVRSDELPAEGEPAKGKKPEVQNHLFYEVMIEQGFDPGASWGSMDTMHFDFVKGYRALVGRGSFGPKLGFQPKN
jgi:hypothetical protein